MRCQRANRFQEESEWRAPHFSFNWKPSGPNRHWLRGVFGAAVHRIRITMFWNTRRWRWSSNIGLPVTLPRQDFSESSNVELIQCRVNYVPRSERDTPCLRWLGG